MPEPALELRGLSYRYPGAAGPALRDVDLAIEAGELVLLSGRSGSGKSTLLRLACGLVPHFHGGDAAGEARACGRDIREHGPAALGEWVGFVAQEPESQVVAATPRAELELPLDLHGEPRAARARAVEEVALALGVEHLLDRPTGSLSGGELQRVALGAALVRRPELVLLDEPTSQLDPVASDELLAILRRLNEEWGTTVVIAEHRLERCLPAADRVIAMAEGRVRFDGAPQPFLEATVEADPALATPGAQLFAGLGLRPLPVRVREARRALAERRPEGSAPPVRPTRADASRPAARPVLTTRGLWVELDAGEGRQQVLRGITLRIDPGEQVALMGRNGAGKSTLMRTAAGMIDPVAGSIAVPAGIALAPQNPSAMIVRDRVADELPGSEGREALQLLGLTSVLDADPRDLSGGERQRLVLALAIAGRSGAGLPGLVCLDEPTRGMDGARKRWLAEWLEQAASTGSGVLVATHDVEFAARFATRVVLLGAGEVIADGSPADVLAGGWHFASEVARITDGAAVTPESGIALLRGAAAESEEPR